MPPDDDAPDPLSGHVHVAGLFLPRLVAEEIEHAARLHGVTPAQMIVTILQDWAIRRRMRREMRRRPPN